MLSILKRNKNLDDYEESLSPKIKADKLTKNIKLLIITDTHGDLALNKELQNKLLSISDFDLCCILGDIHPYDYKFITDNLSVDYMVGLLGNHDNFNILKNNNIKDLNGKIIEINGLKIGGIGGSHKYKQELFPSYTHEESIKMLDKMPKVDILLSHDKPYTKNYHDEIHDGLKGITKYLYEKQIPLVIHGHIHKSYLDNLKNGTIVKGCYRIELLEIKDGQINIIN